MQHLRAPAGLRVGDAVVRNGVPIARSRAHQPSVPEATLGTDGCLTSATVAVLCRPWPSTTPPCNLAAGAIDAADEGDTGPLYCYRHPKSETYVRCGRCDQPICPKCAVQGPVGFRCRQCGLVKSATLSSFTPQQLVLGIGASFGGGAVLGFLGGQVGFYSIFIAFFGGGLIAEAMVRADGHEARPDHAGDALRRAARRLRAGRRAPGRDVPEFRHPCGGRACRSSTGCRRCCRTSRSAPAPPSRARTRGFAGSSGPHNRASAIASSSSTRPVMPRTSTGARPATWTGMKSCQLSS